MNNPQKISYLLPTLKPEACAQTVVNQIESFEPHNYEIVVISPVEPPSGKNIKHVLDTKCTGSLSATNLGYAASTGDIIVVCVDDNYLPKDFLKIFDYFETPEFKNKKVKLANLCPWFGGPGRKMFFKRPEDQKYNGICSFYEEQAATGGVFPRSMSEAAPYEIISFPVFFRETLSEHFNNVIWNERFLQCFADHWLGFYYNLINQSNDELGPKNLWMDPIPGFGAMTSAGHHSKKEIDRQTFLSLVRDSYKMGRKTTYSNSDKIIL